VREQLIELNAAAQAIAQDLLWNIEKHSAPGGWDEPCRRISGQLREITGREALRQLERREQRLRTRLAL